ncbi:hypothetical protein FACS189459_1110 [Bacilli bacterium]|nr:hypothetical protein FACS189459_1110 [Bacilli bacterium]
MKKNKYLISGATEQGLRERNEDSYDFAVNNSNQALLIVCDGIGSDEHSEIVSSSTTKLFTDEFKKINRIDDITMFFEKTLNEAYEHITNISFNYLKGKKMGTTLVMAFINTDGKVTIYNIGDSRLFYFNKKN